MKTIPFIFSILFFVSTRAQVIDIPSSTERITLNNFKSIPCFTNLETTPDTASYSWSIRMLPNGTETRQIKDLNYKGIGLIIRFIGYNFNDTFFLSRITLYTKSRFMSGDSIKPGDSITLEGLNLSKDAYNNHPQKNIFDLSPYEKHGLITKDKNTYIVPFKQKSVVTRKTAFIIDKIHIYCP